MENWPTTVASGRERRDDVDQLAPEADLLLGFAQRGVALVAVDRRLDLAARERDLTPVRRHGLGPLGQDDADLGVLLEQREEHRGGAAAGSRAAVAAGGT